MWFLTDLLLDESVVGSEPLEADVLVRRELDGDFVAGGSDAGTNRTTVPEAESGPIFETPLCLCKDVRKLEGTTRRNATHYAYLPTSTLPSSGRVDLVPVSSRTASVSPSCGCRTSAETINTTLLVIKINARTGRSSDCGNNTDQPVLQTLQLFSHPQGSCSPPQFLRPP